ncbi:amino acid permease [Methanosarcina sp. 2.H.T.1A.6]|uniref:APC family permease n=1 Tax=unclassified Methanosarcina TaxID=2644672 RepID=UPI00062163B8|nr:MULTISPECIES: APC family permease [unclassified Methanosarcina]KKG15076.1 amino acid permease [Methanosarcina sp. 2.H.T.1A.3]KKG19339.1 amino acid permease [Methanosarcina sp. 2.H.T.1A.15]KKG20775.1 amino acid permease [Methanosarcina sp. 2.H.T.1A.8]KKG22092.1 amino acid permease [Methanosarcina sp. 2.H.T.1A.6]
MNRYEPESLTLTGAVSLGTGVMIGAGIFALLGQVAELAGILFPVIFLVGAVVTAFSAYSYVKFSNTYPSAGGIAMYLEKAYGKGVMTGFGGLLMAFSMVINESLVARTFGTYTIQLFNIEQGSFLVPLLGVGLLVFAFGVNISGNRIIEKFSFFMALVKITGISIFGIVGLWLADFSFASTSSGAVETTIEGYLAAVALSVLAYKGFTTITNSGSEIVDPHQNVGRAIIISIAICTVIYFLVSLAVAGSLTLPEIIEAKNFALAEAARPVFGNYGLWFTVGLAIIATISGIIASVFAVSRMLAMLTDMNIIPHRHFGMPGDIQKHTLVYTIVVAILLTIFFDLSRIASLGAIFYLVMDIIMHWGLLRHMREEIDVRPYIIITAIVLDAVILSALLLSKASTDMFLVVMALIMMVLIFLGEKIFLRSNPAGNDHKQI